MDRTVGIDRAVDVFTATLELEPRDQLTTDGESSQPDISPDGKQITYVNGNGSHRTSEFGSEEMSIYVMGIDGGGSRRVSGSGSDEYPDWSPDGARIVFERSFTDIVVLSLADGTEEVIGQGHRPSWSPAGDLIAFTDREGDGSSGLWVMRPDGTERRRLADSTGRQTVWSPDGSRVAFITSDNADPAVQTVDVDTNALVEVPGSRSGVAEVIAWTDEDNLVFVRNVRGPDVEVVVSRSATSASPRSVSRTQEGLYNLMASDNPTCSP